MSDWQDRLASQRADYIDALEQRGFEPVADHRRWLCGEVRTASGPRTVIICIGDAFPYRPPGVYPGRSREDLDITWHTGNDGFMCLYSENDENSTPWMDTDAFLRRVGEWFDRTEAGWPDDAPVMDADRYIESESSGALLIYRDLDRKIGHYVRLAPKGRVVQLGNIETPPHRRKGGNSRQYAAVRDVGDLQRPIRTWDDVREVVPDADQLEQDVRNRRIRAVILRYSRAGRAAALPLRVEAAGNGFVISVYASASDDDDVRHYRSGPARDLLSDKRVLVVGAGAVGSFTADLLARDGVGHIAIMDRQRLTPGNVIRHLCGRDDIGLDKAEAVTNHLARAYGTDTHAVNQALGEPEQALDAVTKYDLVIDATARGSATAMLHEAGRITGNSVLSVCVQNDGDVTRVDLLPPIDGEEPLPRTPRAPHQHPDFYEGGCGDPVSPTPPDAVVQAAALAARHAIGLLTGRPLSNAGEIVTTTRASV